MQLISPSTVYLDAWIYTCPPHQPSGRVPQQMVHLSVAEEGNWGRPSSPKASPGARSCTISSGGCPHACICKRSSSIQALIFCMSLRSAY